MGFFLRKSISAGPFRFNLSGSGLGISAGFKGFRIGSGPRGNYVHMGRGGLYYRASLGGGARRTKHIGRSTRTRVPVQTDQSAQTLSGSMIETGNVLEMKPVNGSDVLEQINDKMRLMPLWPWLLVAGGVLSAVLSSQPTELPLGTLTLAVAGAFSAFLAYYDKQRKTVVIMYDLDNNAAHLFRRFAEEFEKLGSARRIWNVDSAQDTVDRKQHSGARRLLARKAASLTYSVPSVVKTNVTIPAILGGRQSVYFFPDVILIVQGSRAGALSYDQFDVFWTNQVFIEEENVPADAQIVGHTWRYVNKKGDPDRRFNNNRQIPTVLYLEMKLSSTDGLKKILLFSRAMDHTDFDTALNGLRGLVLELKQGALEANGKQDGDTKVSFAQFSTANTGVFSISELAHQIESGKPKGWEFKLTAELLRTNVDPIADQWHRLARGLYTERRGAVGREDALNWCAARVDEVPRICSVLGTLVNERLPASWGPPGQPGDADEIKSVCQKLTTCAGQILAWEETIRFTALPAECDDLKGLLSGFSGPILDQIARISGEIARIFDQGNPSGVFKIELVLKPPDHWEKQCKSALKRAAKTLRVG